MSEARRLFGTDVAPVASERVTVGDVSFTLEEGALRHLRLGNREMIRGVAFLVRDRDWGTLLPQWSVVSREATQDRFSLHLMAVFESGGTKLTASLHILCEPRGMVVTAEFAPDGPFETNRAGFTVLHPAALSGCPVAVMHSDGTVEDALFPKLIDPWQPFKDIASLTHKADGLTVCCTFGGDTFEMEDQRQWGDASYKTYVRPLALPWPYVLTQGETVTQSVAISWQKTGAVPGRPSAPELSDTVVFPDMALLVTAEDVQRLAVRPEDILSVSPQRLLCHVDMAGGDSAPSFAVFARLQYILPALTYDLELVCGFSEPPLTELSRAKALMEVAGFRPDSVMVCPTVDRQSTPPGSIWPECPPLAEIHSASAEVFEGVLRGGGMVSFFPELNRKRPPVGMLDFVSHSLCPIVHAADDLSVMETLEMIPHITRTARAIIGEKAYRIGPSTIAMRQNPYGQRTIPNPGLDRICMADDDPRHRAAFGAAYAIGLACALAPAGVAVWTPSEVHGPRGLSDPLREALTLLASCAGEPVHKATVEDGFAEMWVGDRRITANLTHRVRGGLGPYEWTVTTAQGAGG